MDSVIERFMAKVDKTDTCWLWKGAFGWKKYGRFSPSHSKSYAAHRFSYETFVGPIPKKILVLHKCDQASCVRPDHLFLGTQHDNMLDCLKKGRRPSGENHVMCKLSDNQVAEIRELRGQGMVITKLATRFHVSKSLIGLIVLGEYRKTSPSLEAIGEG